MKLRTYETASSADAYIALEDLFPGANWKGIAQAGAAVGDRWLQAARDAIGDTDALTCIAHTKVGLVRAAISKSGRYAIVWPKDTLNEARSTPPPPGHKRLTINLREEDHQALKVRAAREGTTIRGLIESAISSLIHDESYSEFVAIWTAEDGEQGRPA